MPRPGPRPYECVRRAWHSDRHQPMRGSLIQEIFRIVSEIHSSATKKNKEWQEKLPVVVLKAEEIMYSKANSEVEYMDVKTLWDRTNDAINTIIRREESTETGELLQPCIEAALILGCTARRASRSQRNSNPRCYLSQSAQEPAPVPPGAPDNVTIGGSSHYPPSHPVNPPSAPRFMPHYPTNSRPAAINSSRFSSEPRTPVTPVTHNNNPIASHGPFASKSFPNQTFAMETNHLANMGHSYPLYYGVPGQSTDSQHVFPPFPGSSLSLADPASPQVHAIVNSMEMGLLENVFTNEGAANAINRNAPADLMDKIECPPEVGCDLSLRLGPFSAHSASTEARCSREVEDVELSSPQGGSKCYDFPPKTTKEFCFFPGGNTDEYPESSKWSARDEVLNLDGPSRKRKATFSSHVEGEHFSRRPAFSNNMYFDRMNKPDK